MKKLDKNELRTIDQIIAVPLYASGPEKLLEITKLDLSYVTDLHLRLKKLAYKGEDVDLSLSDNDLENLVKIYSVAVPLVKDFDDVQTLTGYEEEAVEALEKKLKSFISS